MADKWEVNICDVCKLTLNDSTKKEVVPVRRGSAETVNSAREG